MAAQWMTSDDGEKSLAVRVFHSVCYRGVRGEKSPVAMESAQRGTGRVAEALVTYAARLA